MKWSSQSEPSGQGFLLAASDSSVRISTWFSLIVANQRATAALSPAALMVLAADSESVTLAAAVSLRIAAAVKSLPQRCVRERLSLLVQWRKKPKNAKNAKNPMRCAKLWHSRLPICRGGFADCRQNGLRGV